MPIRDLILHNFRRKLFALLLAILVWLTVHFAEHKKQQAAVRNTTTNAPALNP